MRILREPLLHFAIAGALLFGGYRLWTDASAYAPQPPPVTVGEGELRWLRETFAGQWRRDPTPAEMQELLATFLEEALLAREARALGLDDNDIVVRRRLAQKMLFLIDDTTHIAQPSDYNLRLYYADHQEQYRKDTLVSFRQIYFSPTRRPAPASDARAALLRLQSQDGVQPPDGDPLPLDDVFDRLDERSIEALFGPAFASSVAALPVDAWSGPITSGYGQHLIRVTAKKQGEARPFDEVRAEVEEEWRRENATNARTAYVDRLRKKYGVVVPTDLRESANDPVAKQATR